MIFWCYKIIYKILWIISLFYKDFLCILPTFLISFASVWSLVISIFNCSNFCMESAFNIPNSFLKISYLPFFCYLLDFFHCSLRKYPYFPLLKLLSADQLSTNHKTFAPYILSKICTTIIKA